MFGKIRCVGVDHEDHVACKVADACIGMCSNIIKKLMTCLGHGFHALSLSGGYSADGRKNGWVNCTSVIQKCPNNILHALDVFFGEWGAVVSVVTVCTLAPNWIQVALYGACCGFDRTWCWYLNLRSALLM